MGHNLEQTIALLSRGPATLNAMLRGLPEGWTLRNEGEGTWSAFDVVGHLIHNEHANWMPRAKMLLEFGESRTFEPFDRCAHIEASRCKSLNQLLDEFATLRSENLDELRALNLKQEQLDLRGQHPTFGPATLSELLSTWAIHDLTHLHQISRILAYQYRDAVGPWRKYLGVLHCDGHGSAA